MSPTYKLLWFLAMAVLAGVLWLAFRGYLHPSLLVDFAAAWTC